MRYIKPYKIFETGEWASNVDWDYVKENPDDDSEEANWIKQMEEDLNEIKEMIDNEGEIDFEIEDIRGFDLYQGPYGRIKINDDFYTIRYNGEFEFWIEDFPIDNMDPNEHPGFKGYKYEIVEAIIDHYKPINKETRKYNL